MKISKIAYIFIFLGMILIISYLIYAVFIFSDKEKDNVCKNMEIQLMGENQFQLISEPEIVSIIEENNLNPVGKTYKRINTEVIENELSKNPMIKNVECYKTPAGVVYIEIQERTPKFIIAGNECYYIDEDKKMVPLSQNYAAYLPVASGVITKSFATGKLFDFVSYIEKNPFWNAQIEQIYVHDDQRVELITRVGDAVIQLGKLDNYEIKLSSLYSLYKKAFNVIGWNRYKTINLEFKDQIVCSKTGIVRVEPQVEDTTMSQNVENKIIATVIQ